MRNFRPRSKRGSLSVSVFSQHNWVLTCYWHFRLRCVDQTNLQFLMSRDVSHRLHQIRTGSGSSIKGGGSMFPLWYISNISISSCSSTFFRKLAEPLTTQRSMCAQRRLSWMSFLITSERRINALASDLKGENVDDRWNFQANKLFAEILVSFALIFWNLYSQRSVKCARLGPEIFGDSFMRSWSIYGRITETRHD